MTETISPYERLELPDIQSAEKLLYFLKNNPEIWFTANELDNILNLGKDYRRKLRKYAIYLIRKDPHNFITSGQRGYIYSLNPDNFTSAARQLSAKAHNTKEHADIAGIQERLLKKLSVSAESKEIQIN
ncbi:hypothetical protein DLJ48_06715 [Oenococcus sicerae]|uniref:Helix-turn-helix domain-containing protein n=1 Tax=Oenococcus sicerae TaxID=2203724 RepID=A0ABX5QN42_9LACO|nr:hypothetical protein [Oenococcus sicerae]QAS70235.1 hypothetical protein DLJ48_06715 [Oenococcus sicerae]